jgi:hypothetical protein
VFFPLWAGWTFDHVGTGFPFWTSAALVFATLLLTFGITPGDGSRGGPAPRGTPPGVRDSASSSP